MKESRVLDATVIVGPGPTGMKRATGLAKERFYVQIINQRQIAVGQADGTQPSIREGHNLRDNPASEGCQVYLMGKASLNFHRAYYCPNLILMMELKCIFQTTLHQGTIDFIFAPLECMLSIKMDRSVMSASLHLSSAYSPVHGKVVWRRIKVQDRNNSEFIHAIFIITEGGTMNDGVPVQPDAHSWAWKALRIQIVDGERTDTIWHVVDTILEPEPHNIRDHCTANLADHSSYIFILHGSGDRVRVYIQLYMADSSASRANCGKLNSATPLKITSARYERDSSNMIECRSCCINQCPNYIMNGKTTEVPHDWADTYLLKEKDHECCKYSWHLAVAENTLCALEGIEREQFPGAFQASGSSISGVGIYTTVTGITHQDCAANLIIGMRVPPHVFIRAADASPCEILDLLEANSRFKVVIFTGDTTDDVQMLRVHALAEELSQPESFFIRFGMGDPYTMFDVLTISSGKRDLVHYTDIPTMFRPHWSKVLLDDVDTHGRCGGGGYAAYGISPFGAVVIVQPDGYIGTIAPFEHIQDITNYFTAVMQNPWIKTINNRDSKL